MVRVRHAAAVTKKIADREAGCPCCSTRPSARQARGCRTCHPHTRHMSAKAGSVGGRFLPVLAFARTSLAAPTEVCVGRSTHALRSALCTNGPWQRCLVSGDPQTYARARVCGICGCGWVGRGAKAEGATDQSDTDDRRQHGGHNGAPSDDVETTQTTTPQTTTRESACCGVGWDGAAPAQSTRPPAGRQDVLARAPSTPHRHRHRHRHDTDKAATTRTLSS